MDDVWRLSMSRKVVSERLELQTPSTSLSTRFISVEEVVSNVDRTGVRSIYYEEVSPAQEVLYIGEQHETRACRKMLTTHSSCIMSLPNELILTIISYLPINDIFN